MMPWTICEECGDSIQSNYPLCEACEDEPATAKPTDSYTDFMREVGTVDAEGRLTDSGRMKLFTQKRAREQAEYVLQEVKERIERLDDEIRRLEAIRAYTDSLPYRETPEF